MVCKSYLQRRFASEEAQTQSEPAADRAEEGQHGDNSIAASSEEQSDPSPGEPLSEAPEEAASSFQEQNQPSSGEPLSEVPELAAADTSVAQQQSEPQPAQSEQPSTVGDLASAAAEKAKETASNAFDALAPGLRGEESAARQQEPPPSEGPLPSECVYVGNLFFDVKEDDIRRKFQEIGRIQSVKMIKDNRGLSKG
ncbi:MAG: hypothetical protein Q9225_006998, partial [Loekoesia sp. 1 TL-2023]